MIHDRRIALIFRSFSFVFCLMGILAITQVFKGSFHGGTFLYYTLQSNILVLGLFGYLIVRTAMGLKNNGAVGSSSYAPRLGMICAVDIFLTFLVYWVMLVPQSFSMAGGMSLWTFDNLSVHAVTPILCFLDYIFFSESHHLKYRDIFFTLIFPLVYFIVMSIVGACGYVFRYDAAGVAVHFPYFFFDYDRIGGMAAVYVLALIVIFALIGHGLYFLDKKWNKKILIPRQKS